MNPETDRVASPRSKARFPRTNGGFKRETREKRDRELHPVAEKIAQAALEKYREQFGVIPSVWTHLDEGHKKEVRKQLIKLIKNNKLVSSKSVRQVSARDRVAELAAEIIIGDHLLKAEPCVGDKNKVVIHLTSEGEQFLGGTSLGEIRRERAEQQSVQAKHAKGGRISFIGVKAHKAGHPTMHDPVESKKKVSVGA